MSERRTPLARVARDRLEAAISVHEEILSRHPSNTETHKYSRESLRKLRAELARRNRQQNPTVLASRKVAAEVAKHQMVQSMDGVEVGQHTDTPHGPSVVRSIYRHRANQPWMVGVWNIKENYREAIPLSQITRRGKRRRVSGCYAVGPAKIRRRKVNREGSTVAKRRPVSGCYVIGKARRRRRKANPVKRPVPCYRVGKKRIRRRKMNPTGVALYANSRGHSKPKYVGSVSHAVARVLRKAFPGALRLTSRRR
jgi:hypothetical protein